MERLCSSAVMRRNVVAKPTIAVGVIAARLRVPLVGGFLGNFGAEDFVN